MVGGNRSIIKTKSSNLSEAALGEELRSSRVRISTIMLADMFFSSKSYPYVRTYMDKFVDQTSKNCDDYIHRCLFKIKRHFKFDLMKCFQQFLMQRYGISVILPNLNGFFYNIFGKTR